MSNPLRLFLLTRRSEADWSFFVTQSVDDAEAEWTRLRHNGVNMGLLHIGFGRPIARTFINLFSEGRFQLLATASAKFSFPSGYRFSRNPVTSVDGLEVYSVLKGFGFDLDEPEIEINLQTAHTSSAPGHELARSPLDSRSAWLESFQSVAPELIDNLRELGITSEDSYFQLEGLLPLSARTLIGQFRFEQIIRDRTSPIDVVRCAPPWLRSQKLSNLSLTVRLSNVFANKSIIHVSDLDSYSEADLLHLKNFGRHSMAHLVDALLEGLRRGAQYEKIEENLSFEQLIIGETSHDDDHRIQDDSAIAIGLVGSLMKSLSGADDRDRDILLARMGFFASPRTLEELGSEYGVSRERIRQLEKRLVTKIGQRELWDDILRYKLKQILSERTEELPLYGLEVIDPWFRGTSDKEDALHYLIEAFGDGSFFVIKIGATRYISSIDQEMWEDSLKSSQRLLASAVDLGWTESDCEFTVRSLFSDRGGEMASLLWTEASKLCRFSGSPGNKLLIAYGRGLEQAVQAVLEESKSPLHTSEVAELVAQALGKPVEESQVRNAVASLGLLLGRGTYGLRKHVPLSDQDMDEIARIASSVVLDDGGARQWHASELVSAVVEADPAYEELDKYNLNAALQLKSELSYLGRLVWAKPSLDQKERIDVFETIVDILHSAGGPLSGTEINARLSKIRGLNSVVQIWNRDPVVRVGRGLWGLNDRDVDLKRDRQIELIDAVHRALYSSRKGIHIDEIFERIGSHWSIQPEAAFSIVSQDSRISASVGRYLYLTEWGSPRRLTLEAAYTQLARQVPGPMNFTDIKSWLEFSTERIFEKSAVSHLLSRLGSKYLGDGIWNVQLPDSLDKTKPNLETEE